MAIKTPSSRESLFRIKWGYNLENSQRFLCHQKTLNMPSVLTVQMCGHFHFTAAAAPFQEVFGVKSASRHSHIFCSHFQTNVLGDQEKKKALIRQLLRSIFRGTKKFLSISTRNLETILKVSTNSFDYLKNQPE